MILPLNIINNIYTNVCHFLCSSGRLLSRLKNKKCYWFEIKQLLNSNSCFVKSFFWLQSFVLIFLPSMFWFIPFFNFLLSFCDYEFRIPHLIIFISTYKQNSPFETYMIDVLNTVQFIWSTNVVRNSSNLNDHLFDLWRV